jgi:hypothetical protein
VFHDLNIDDFKSKPPDCACSRSPFIYNPAGQVITGDLNIIINTINPLCEMCSPKSLIIVRLSPSARNILMDSVEDNARQWTERLKSGSSLIQIIINKVSESMSSRSTSIFIDPNVAKHLSLLHDKYVIVSADKALQYCFCVNQITSTA